MEFLEVLTEGLERVLMVRGGGREVITIYSWRHFAISFPHPHHCVLHLHFVRHHVYSHVHGKNLYTEWSPQVSSILQVLGSQSIVIEGCFFLDMTLLLWVIRPPNDAVLFTCFKLYYSKLYGVQIYYASYCKYSSYFCILIHLVIFAVITVAQIGL